MKCERCGERMLLRKVLTLSHGVGYYLPDDSSDWVEEKVLSKEVVVVSAQLCFSFQVRRNIY
jgi:hypothetical protein